MNYIGDIRVFSVPKFLDKQGYLVAYDAKSGVTVDLLRVFVVSGHSGATRGRHAHRDLTQVIVCVHGSCLVICDDGKEKKEIVLDRPDLVLEIPPGIWSEQSYLVQDTMLMVLCDHPYEEGDYIRSYDEFMAFRGEQRP